MTKKILILRPTNTQDSIFVDKMKKSEVKNTHRCLFVSLDELSKNSLFLFMFSCC